MSANSEEDGSQMEVSESECTEDSESDNAETEVQDNNTDENQAAQAPSEINLTLKSSGSILVQDSLDPDSPVFQAKMFTATWTGNMHGFPDIPEENSEKSQASGDKAMDANCKPPSGHNRRHGAYPGHGGPGDPPPNPPKPDLKFKDCGGLEKQITYLQTAVLNPFCGKNQNYQLKRFNLDPPKGVLFYGPPGTGKTRLAQALGNELAETLGRRVHFIYRKGLDIASKWFGQSSKNLRTVFNEAKDNQPCILFFDELDGLCPSRDKPNMHQGNISIITTMLGLMDELPKGKVIVIGATNRLEAIDPALRRPGRFDKYLEFLPPNEKGRLSILNIHTNKWKIPPGRNLLEWLSQRTIGFSGADLSKLCLDAFDSALLRAMSGHKNINGDYLPISTINLSKLAVSDDDWKSALEKMKPSNSAVFGSSLYVPPPSLGTHVEPLIQDDVKQITKLLVKLYSDSKTTIASGQTPNVRSLYVWSGSTSSSVCTNEVVLSEVLKNQDLEHCSIYCISQTILQSIPIREWATKVKNTITEALSTTDAIVYIQNIKSFCDLIRSTCTGLSLNMQQQLERLRGTSVVLLASGSKKLSELCAQNPFQKVLLKSSNTCYEIVNPSQENRDEFFLPLFACMMMDGKRQWTQNDVMALATVHEAAVTATKDKDIGEILLLCDSIIHGKVTTSDEVDSPTLIRKLMNIVAPQPRNP